MADTPETLENEIAASEQTFEQAVEAAIDVDTKPPAKRLVSNISGRDFPKVECWTLLGTMLGVFPVLEGEPKHVEIDGVKGWKATVTATTMGGVVVGRASALCMRSESNWRNRDEYALASMAQTRATSKALRQPLDFVMRLAGLEATPAEEMTDKTTEAVAQPEPEAEAETASVEQLDELRATLKMLEGVKGWSEKEVVTQAAKVFRPAIKKLEDLTPDEATDITKAAKASVTT